MSRGRKVDVTSEVYIRLKKAHEDNECVTEVAKELGIDANRARALIRYHFEGKKYRSLTETEKETFLSLRRRGFSDKQIADMTGKSEGTIIKFFRRRERESANKHPVIEMAKSGFSIGDIAVTLNIPLDVCREIFNKNKKNENTLRQRRL